MPAGTGGQPGYAQPKLLNMKGYRIHFCNPIEFERKSKTRLLSYYEADSRLPHTKQFWNPVKTLC